MLKWHRWEKKVCKHKDTEKNPSICFSQYSKQPLAILNNNSPYTNSAYSSLLVPRWFLASHRYVPLSVLLRFVMISSLPSTIIRSTSGSTPPSFVHNTRSGLQQWVLVWVFSYNFIMRKKLITLNRKYS